MTGRPVNEDRQLSIELGLKTYQGIRHVPCGTTERYVKGGSCVHCARVIATEQREARKYLRHSLDARAAMDMQAALEADGEKLRQLTGEDHGPYFPDEPLDNPEPMVEESEDDAEARRQAAIDELM